MKLLSITKEVDELSLFEKLFLLDRIWKDLSLSLEGLQTTCAADETFMADVMNYCADEIDDFVFEEDEVKEEIPKNVVYLNARSGEK